MAIELTFKQVAAYIKKDQPHLIDAADKLLGVTLICSPILIGPAALPILGLLTAKNELVRLGKSVFEAVVGRKDDDFLAHHDRMQKAYGLICFTSFFEALDRTLPENLRQHFELLASEKESISKKAIQTGKVKEERTLEGDAQGLDLSAAVIPFPHPLDSFSDQERV